MFKNYTRKFHQVPADLSLSRGRQMSAERFYRNPNYGSIKIAKPEVNTPSAAEFNKAFEVAVREDRKNPVHKQSPFTLNAKKPK